MAGEVVIRAQGLSKRYGDAVAVDRGPLMLRMADANLAVYDLSARFVCADVLAAKLPPVDAAFADPGRRPGGRRTLSVHDSEPPVPAVLARFPDGFPLAVKVAPGALRW